MPKSKSPRARSTASKRPTPSRIARPAPRAAATSGRARAGSRKKAGAPAPRVRTATPKPRTVPPSAPPARVPSAIGLVSHHLDYTSHDMDAVRHFYVDLLGFSQSNLDPQMNYLYVCTSPSSSLGFMPPMPGPPEQWRPPREPALYFIVEDVDGAHRELTGRGVSFDQAPTDMPWGHRVAVLRDPEGRRVYLAQALAR